LYPVWSFAAGKTPEVIAALRQLLSLAKPGFLRLQPQKMRPNSCEYGILAAWAEHPNRMSSESRQSRR
jgi:hypothetical protein